MCARTRGPVAAGRHGTVEEVVTQGTESGSTLELRVVVNVPFRLESIAEARLDISRQSLLLQGPSRLGDDATLQVPLPQGYTLDPDRATARYSRRKQQLVVSSPNLAADAGAGEKVGSQLLEAPIPAAAMVASAAAAADVAAVTSTAATGNSAADEGEEAEDDDLPPPLDAARSLPQREGGLAAQGAAPSAARGTTDSGHVPDSEAPAAEANQAAEALMQQALEARETRRRATEEARKGADLASGGLKKGFLSRGKAPSLDPHHGSRASPAVQGASEPDSCMPFINGALDPDAARRESLKLPEVQRAMQQGVKKLQTDQSWLTPQLMQALQCRPDLLKGLSNPHIMEAFSLMQTDPESAKKRYEDDQEVTSFFKEFSSLMATHFDVLGKDSAPVSKPQSAAPVAAASSSGDKPAPEARVPEVAEILQDPQMRQLLLMVRSGRPLEMHDLCRERPQLFQKVKMLLDAGLLSVQQ